MLKEGRAVSILPDQVPAERRRLLASVRKAAILDAVRERGSVTVTEMAGRLAVSEMTIRRDLVDLDREGHLTRTHGGAVAPQTVVMDRDEPSFDTRLEHQRQAKEMIASAAAQRIGAARTVALDVGATTFLLAQHLRDRTGLKLFTNSLRIATSLAESAQDIYVPGGRVRGNEMAIGGSTAVDLFEKLWFDVAFLGVSGITEGGLFDYSFEDTELKRVYLRRSTRKIVLCDSSKFQRMSLVRVSGFDDIDMLVTEALPPPEIDAALRDAGVDVLIAPPFKRTAG